MLDTTTYQTLGVDDIANGIKRNQFSAIDVFDCACDLSDAINPKLNALVTDCRDIGFKQLNIADKHAPFYGVPIVIKDLGFSLKDTLQTSGSQWFRKRISTTNCKFIDKILELGFIPIAKSNTPELGLSYVTEPILYGPCYNPIDLNKTVGGSSGGSAAAVKAGIVPIATANDGGGSIRIPAACCGLLGFKPTHELMPKGLMSNAWSGMACSFVITRQIKDNINVFDALIEDDYRSSLITNAQNKPLKIGCFDNLTKDFEVDDVNLQALSCAKAVLARHNHQLHACELKLKWERIGPPSLTLIAAHVYFEVSQYEQISGKRVDESQLEPSTWVLYQKGLHTSLSEYLKAQNELMHELIPLKLRLAEYDVVLLNALASPVPDIGYFKPQDSFDEYLVKHVKLTPFMSMFNQLGTPAMTLPLYPSTPIPTSVQLASRRFGDCKLLNLAAQLGATMPFINHPICPK